MKHVIQLIFQVLIEFVTGAILYLITFIFLYSEIVVILYYIIENIEYIEKYKEDNIAHNSNILVNYCFLNFY